MLDNTFTKISEILFAYIQEEVYVCCEDSVNTNIIPFSWNDSTCVIFIV